MENSYDWELYNRVDPVLSLVTDLKNPNEWRNSIHQKYPTLDNLYRRGRSKQYYNTLALAGESYEEYLAKKTAVTMPTIRRAMPDLLSNELVGVQPMSAPSPNTHKLIIKKT